MQNQEVDQVMTFLSEAWAHSKMSVATATVWGQELAAYDYDDTMVALRKLARTNKWRPSLAEIIEYLEADEGKSSLESFAHVWEQIGKRPRRVDEIEAETVRRLGGWDALGMWLIDERHYHAKRYCSAYDEIVVEGRKKQPRRAAVAGSPVLSLNPKDGGDGSDD